MSEWVSQSRQAAGDGERRVGVGACSCMCEGRGHMHAWQVRMWHAFPFLHVHVHVPSGGWTTGCSGSGCRTSFVKRCFARSTAFEYSKAMIGSSSMPSSPGLGSQVGVGSHVHVYMHMCTCTCACVCVYACGAHEPRG